MLAAIVAAIASDISFSMESSAETYVSGGLVDRACVELLLFWTGRGISGRKLETVSEGHL